MRPIAFLIILLSIAVNATAAVYKWVQPDGSVIYSDRPPPTKKNAAPVTLPPIQEIKIEAPPPASSTSEDKTSENAEENQPAKVDYTKLEIIQPADQSVIRDNAGRVSVALDLEPALQKGDITTISLDGKQLGQGSGTSYSLSNVARGSHTVQATVKDANGSTLITSPTITFDLLRASAARH